ncbi:MAG: PAS domain S-box protein [Gemmatimonadetes bacterium]|nr:PAS domain S-box protein [Gemmatimonadota bacterium]
MTLRQFERADAATVDAIWDRVVETVPALVVLLDARGRILRFNQACELLTAYSEAEVVGAAPWEFLVPSEQTDAVRDVFQNLTAGNFPSTFRNDWIARSGERCPIEWVNSVVTDEGGGVLCVIGTGRDLRRELATERLAAELEAAQARTSGIISAAADAIISVATDQRILMFNEAAEEIFGWTAEEIIGKPLSTLIPERFRSTHAGTHVPGFAFAAPPVAARRMGERREIFGLRKSGAEFPAEAAISKLSVGGDAVMTVILRDVTDRKQLEWAQRFLLDAGLALSQSIDYETTLRRVASLAVRGLADFCIVDTVATDGTIERREVAHADPAKADLARRLAQFPLDRTRPHLATATLATRRPVAAEFTPETLAETAQGAEHRALLEELRPVSYMSAPLVARDQLLGAIVFLSSSKVYGAPDLEVAGELARRAALAIDHARMYEEAGRAARARDEVMSIVAHDLRNPISAIRVGATLLLREVNRESGSVRMQRYLEGIVAATDRMERLTTNLLDLHRIENGQLILDRSPCSPASILEPLRPTFEMLAAEHGVAFECSEAGAASAVLLADCDRLGQVLENLLGNAFKFTPAGGTVSVSVAEDGDDLEFQVRDTGCGMDAAQLTHLFERYWQAEPVARQGLGLGLAIARGIVEAHGGRIWAESEPGRGTSFHFTIPRRDAATGRNRGGLGR